MGLDSGFRQNDDGTLQSFHRALKKNRNRHFRFSLLINSLNIFAGGSGSKNPVTRYFLPSSLRADGETLSLGISIRIESDGSATLIFIASCQTVCPSRDQHQLMTTPPALDSRPFLHSAPPPLP